MQILKFIRRTILGGLIAVIPVCALAEGESTAKAQDFVLNTWEPTRDAIVQAVENGKKIDFSSFDRSIRAGASALSGSACETLFAVTDDFASCRSDSLEAELARTLERHALSMSFAQLIASDPTNIMVDLAIDQIGSGRIKLLSQGLMPMFTEQFDIGQNLRYTSWMTDNCFTRLDGENREAFSDQPTYEDCLEHRFTIYLKQSYCAENDNDVCLGNAGWMYGFFIRRYLADDEAGVEAWQAAFKRMVDRVNE